MNLPSRPIDKNISIHALLAESDLDAWKSYYVCRISIHALLAESDYMGVTVLGIQHISIHALLAESDLWVLRKVPLLGIFLSTLSLRRATHRQLPSQSREKSFLSTLSLRRATAGAGNNTIGISHFYPRSPCGERLSR